MKINFGYCSRKYYNKSNIKQWLWTFQKYQYVNGFIARLFGFYINVREDDATEKLINLANRK